MYNKEQITFQLPDLQDQNSVMLCWRSLSEWGSKCVAFSFALKYGQYVIYDRLHPITTLITHDARAKIFDTLLTIMFRMGQGACLLCLVIMAANSFEKDTGEPKTIFWNLQ